MTEFLREWTPRVYRFAMRLTGDPHLAEDLTQETLLRAWQQRQGLRAQEAAQVWVFRIASNLWRAKLRRSRSPVARASAMVDEPPANDRSPETLPAVQDELRVVLRALDGLPARQREVLYLHACDDMPIGQIAAVLGITTTAAKASLSLARKRMRQLAPGVWERVREMNEVK